MYVLTLNVMKTNSQDDEASSSPANGQTKYGIKLCD